MSVMMETLATFLEVEEPDYGQAAMLGPDTLPLLLSLVQNSEETLLASKAAFLATMMPHAEALSVMEAAVLREEPEIRVAAAAGIQNLMGTAADAIEPPDRAHFQTQAGNLLVRLLADEDMGVRKAANKSLQAQKTPDGMAALSAMAANAPAAVRTSLLERLK